MNTWDVVAVVYGVISVLTILPILIPVLHKNGLGRDAALFRSPAHLSEASHLRCNNYASSITSTLGSWRKRTIIYVYFHYYFVCWTIFSSWLIPLIGATLGGGEAKWLIVVVSSHIALVLSFHNGLKVPENLRALRLGKAEFYDLHSQLMHRPNTLGKTEDEQLTAYFDAAEDIRKKVRAAEIEGLANVEHGDNRSA